MARPKAGQGIDNAALRQRVGKAGRGAGAVMEKYFGPTWTRRHAVMNPKFAAEMMMKGRADGIRAISEVGPYAYEAMLDPGRRVVKYHAPAIAHIIISQPTPRERNRMARTLTFGSDNLARWVISDPKNAGDIQKAYERHHERGLWAIKRAPDRMQPDLLKIFADSKLRKEEAEALARAYMQERIQPGEQIPWGYRPTKTVGYVPGKTRPRRYVIPALKPVPMPQPEVRLASREPEVRPAPREPSRPASKTVTHKDVFLALQWMKGFPLKWMRRNPEHAQRMIQLLQTHGFEGVDLISNAPPRLRKGLVEHLSSLAGDTDVAQSANRYIELYGGYGKRKSK